MHTGRNRLWNRPFLQLLDVCDLDLGFGHRAHHPVSLIDLYLQNKFISLKSKKLFVDGRTDNETLGKLRGVELTSINPHTQVNVNSIRFKNTHKATTHCRIAIIKQHLTSVLSDWTWEIGRFFIKFSKFGERGFSRAGPTAWNSLSHHLHQISDTGLFKRRLKTELFRRVYVACSC